MSTTTTVLRCSSSCFSPATCHAHTRCQILNNPSLPTMRSCMTWYHRIIFNSNLKGALDVTQLLLAPTAIDGVTLWGEILPKRNRKLLGEAHNEIIQDWTTAFIATTAINNVESLLLPFFKHKSISLSHFAVISSTTKHDLVLRWYHAEKFSDVR